MVILIFDMSKREDFSRDHLSSFHGTGVQVYNGMTKYLPSDITFDCSVSGQKRCIRLKFRRAVVRSYAGTTQLF